MPRFSIFLLLKRLKFIELIGISIPLPHKNQSSRTYKDWRKYYTLDDINFMLERYSATRN